MKNKLEQNIKTLKYCSIITTIIGLILAYIYYGIEPLETISGFIVGVSLSFLIITLTYKYQNNVHR